MVQICIKIEAHRLNDDLPTAVKTLGKKGNVCYFFLPSDETNQSLNDFTFFFFLNIFSFRSDYSDDLYIRTF